MRDETHLKNRLTMLMFLLVLPIVPAFAGRVIYVDADVTGLNDGSSWQNAYKYLQDALADASSAEKPIEIRVAQGIYKPDQGASQTPGDRAATFQLINGVSIKGGYAGLGEADPNAREIEKYETVLSGDLKGDDVEVSDPCDLFAEPSRAENSYHVVTGSGTNEAAVLDGLTITSGNANGTEQLADRCGGGMYNWRASPTVSNCRFTDNRGMSGGAMCNWSSAPKLTACTFAGNSADEGGGMYNRSPGGGLNASRCSFSANWAKAGGAMCNYQDDPKVTNCTFIGNSADAGGAMANTQSSPKLIECVFSGNSASSGGAMSYILLCKPILTNCVLSGNSAEGEGGAIYCSTLNTLTFTGCTLSGNVALRGSALVCWSHQRTYPGDVQITNCILWDGGNEIWNEDDSEIKVRFSDVQGGWPGEGNINADPRFADPNNGDYHLKSQAGRWEPTGNSKLEILNSKLRNGAWVGDDVTSPCIDAGDPASPIGPEPFPNGGIINMGAYGGTVDASKSYFGEPICETIVAGDLNGDCKVDFEDLAILASRWLTEN